MNLLVVLISYPQKLVISEFASSEFKLKRLARKLLQVKKETKDMKADIKAMEDDLSNSVKLPSILIELEDRYQRIIDGITEDPD